MDFTWWLQLIGRYRAWRAARFTALVRRDLQMSAAWLRHEASR